MGRLKIKLWIIGCILIASCKHEPGKLPASNYPEKVGKIILNKCATAGCHNDASYNGAGGLNLNTWDDLFKGGNSGAVVIPYKPDFSTLCFYTNTDTNLGVTLVPTMPVNNMSLSKEEYLLLRDWIEAGAPDVSGTIKFADDPARKKMYVTNRLCDVITVFDSETLLQMRYVDAGNDQREEYPVCVKVSPDKRHWYVSFFSTTNIIQKFSAVDDKLIGTIDIGGGAWTSFEIKTDSKYGFFVDNSNPGKVAYVDLEQMKLLATYTFNNKFRYPTGIVINEELKKVYVGNTNGNYIYTIDITDPLNPVVKERTLDGGQVLLYNPSIDPVGLLKDHADNKCYIACAMSAEIRVVNMANDSVESVIPLGSYPAHMSYSPLKKKLFITCPDSKVFADNRGAVIVVDVVSNAIHKQIKSGFQPYGIAVDDQRQVVAVVNANLSKQGNEPHHTTNCGGRNGNVSFIDLNTMLLIQEATSEVAVYPYGISAR